MERRQRGGSAEGVQSLLVLESANKPEEREIKFSSFLKQKELDTHVADLKTRVCSTLEIQVPPNYSQEDLLGVSYLGHRNPPKSCFPLFSCSLYFSMFFSVYLSVSHSWSIIYETDAQSSCFTQITECECL